MIRIIIKQLWTLRRRNVWLYAELFVCVCLSWYIVDYGIQLLHNRSLPNGFETDGVYRAHFIPKKGEAYSEAVAKSYAERIRSFPGVRQLYQSSHQSAPYSGSNALRGVSLDSTLGESSPRLMIYEKSVEEDTYFDILQITSIYSGKPIRLPYDDSKAVVLSRSLARYLFGDEDPRGKLVDEAKKQLIAKGQLDWRVVDVAEDFKQDDYRLPVPTVFIPSRGEESLRSEFLFSTDERFNPETFSEELLKCRALEQDRRSQEFWSGITKREMMGRTVLLFFVVSIALGVIGAFWFRTERRRGELALHLVMGCTPRRLSWHIVLEALVLLLIAFVPALVVNALIYSAELTLSLGQSYDVWWQASTEIIDQDRAYWINIGWMRFALGNLITLGLMSLVVAVSAWLPARKASSIPPVEALATE